MNKNFQVGWNMWLKAATARRNQATLTELIPGSTYIFRVKAENPYGVSNPSPETAPVHLPNTSQR